ncbi:MAG: glycosyltransferase family 4 protein [Candidatus Cloacimonetes bacterium]|nr:glycosyltransferase family 4 protein [Candidatus Cloacimonadota bacterium]
MKILVISNLFPPNILGGAENFAYELSKTLAVDNEVLVVTTCDEKYSSQYEIQDFENMKIIRFFPKNMYWVFDRSHKPTWKKLLWHLLDYFNLHSYFSIKKLIVDFQPDIVHTHNIDGFSGSVWKAAKSQNIPVVHTAHDGHLVCPKANFLHKNKEVDCGKTVCKVFRYFHLLNAQNIDLFVSPSKFLLKVYLQHNMKVKETLVIENGVLSTPSSITEKQSGTLQVLFMGQISEHKGIGCLLQTIQYFKNKDVTFHIAGKGPLEDKITSIQQENSKVIYHGFISGDKKQELLAKSHILLFPSQCYENSPLSILEAYQNGLIIIASNIGGIPELINESSSGFLFDLDQPQKVCHIIDGLLNSPYKQKELHQKSIDYFQSFKIENCAKHYQNAYQKLLNSN